MNPPDRAILEVLRSTPTCCICGDDPACPFNAPESVPDDPWYRLTLRGLCMVQWGTCLFVALLHLYDPSWLTTAVLAFCLLGLLGMLWIAE